MIVVDASAIIAFFLREEGWMELSKYMVRTVSIDHVVKEFYNAVWKAVIVYRRMSVEEAYRVIDLFKSYLSRNMEVRAEEDYLDKALKIALENGVTVYDALYVALAVYEGKPLLTLDEKQRESSKKYGVTVLP